MKTRFYKILYKNKDVVYVGVTTRSITERFKEHLTFKGLNENYSILEFDCIKHPEFTTLEVYYEEKRKVAELEQQYIKEELEKGSHLLNISEGGEWGAKIVEKLRKEEFRRRFGSYDRYKEHKRRIDLYCGWLRGWVRHRSENKLRKWFGHWVECRSYNETKRFLRDWVKSKKEDYAKKWLANWAHNKSAKRLKIWMKCWVLHRSESRTKVWLRNWISCRSRNKVVVWLRNWIVHRN